jgi:hypothetical protein
MHTVQPDEREQRIRMRAHQLWEQEGRPDGQSERHWETARLLIAIEDNPDAEQVPLERSMAQPAEPLQAVEGLGDLPGLNDQGERQDDPRPRPRADEVG